MSAGPSTLPPPRGWYADPEGDATLRWWDGRSWSDTTQKPAQGPPPPFNTLAIVSLATAAAGLFFIAIPLGFIGLRQADRRGERGRQFALAGLVGGTAMLVYFVVVFTFFIVVALTTPSST